MKKYITISALAALTVFGGCSEDFLNVESPNELPADSYFNSEDKMYENLVAAYDPLEWFDWANGQYCPLLIMSDIMSDQIWPGGGTSTDNLFWQLMSNYAATPNECMSGLWTDAYSGVKRSNDALRFMENVTNISEDSKKLFTAEVHILRAFYYTILWKFYGNIPYYTTELETPYIAEQISADQVYNNIIADIDAALALNVLPMKADADKLGRVTLAMAYMLYAEVVMYQSDDTRKSTALKYMEEIIASGKYALVEDFAEIFTVEGEWGSESIWEINYMNDGATRSWGWPQGAGGTVLPRLISPRGWADGTDGVEGGWGFCQIRQETANLFEDDDNRKAPTIYDASAYNYEKSWASTDLFLMKYIARNGYNANQKADADLNYGNNLRIYRFSETLLNAAELGSPNAQKYLDMVRHRAGLGSIAANEENIIKERAIEFVGEGNRYWDLVRTGRAASTLVPDKEGFRTNTWSSNKKYLPIPQSEINAANGTLKQNAY